MYTSFSWEITIAIFTEEMLDVTIGRDTVLKTTAVTAGFVLA